MKTPEAVRKVLRGCVLFDDCADHDSGLIPGDRARRGSELGVAGAHRHRGTHYRYIPYAVCDPHHL